jgi:hypothetical protein
MAVENREVLPRARRVFPVRVVEEPHGRRQAPSLSFCEGQQPRTEGRLASGLASHNRSILGKLLIRRCIRQVDATPSDVSLLCKGGVGMRLRNGQFHFGAHIEPVRQSSERPSASLYWTDEFQTS